MSRQKRPGRSRRALGLEEPWRTCVGTRERGRREDMLRFVRAPDGAVCFDVASSMPHRGAWTAPTTRAIEQAALRGGFERAFAAPVLVDGPALVAEVERILEAEAAQGIGLLRRAGALTVGQAELEDAVARGEVSAIVAAVDLAPRTRSLARNLAPSAVVGPPMVILGQALGRGPTGLLGLRGDGPLARRVKNHLSRLARLRGQDIHREPERQEVRP